MCGLMAKFIVDVHVEVVIVAHHSGTNGSLHEIIIFTFFDNLSGIRSHTFIWNRATIQIVKKGKYYDFVYRPMRAIIERVAAGNSVRADATKCGKKKTRCVLSVCISVRCDADLEKKKQKKNAAVVSAMIFRLTVAGR